MHHARSLLWSVAALIGWSLVTSALYGPFGVSPEVTESITLTALLAPVFTSILVPRRVGVFQLFLAVAVVASAVAVRIRKLDPSIDSEPAKGAVWLMLSFAALVCAGITVRALMPGAALLRQRLAAVPLTAAWLVLVALLFESAADDPVALPPGHLTFLLLMAPLGAAVPAPEQAAPHFELDRSVNAAA
jgi:hypothetical protein